MIDCGGVGEIGQRRCLATPTACIVSDGGHLCEHVGVGTGGL